METRSWFDNDGVMQAEVDQLKVSKQVLFLIEDCL